MYNNLTSVDVRNFFFDVYHKYKAQHPLSDMEKIILQVIIDHPQYEPILNNKEKYLTYEWHPDRGEENPFLHLSSHLTIVEQLAINHPPQIRQLYQQLLIKHGDKHMVEHELIDCIAEMIWQAGRNNSPLDINVYLACVKSKVGEV